MDPAVISELLETLADHETARRTAKSVQTLRGVRGTPVGEIARIASAVWQEERPTLPQSEDDLSELFSSAYEDGLVAIGLLAALGPDHPEDALRIGREWLERTDDIHTADALGWLVLGPACLGSDTPMVRLAKAYQNHGRVAVRRATVTMGLAALPVRIEGPSAAPLRAKLQIKQVRFVNEALSEHVAGLCTRHLRDATPGIQKPLRRLLREWVKADPEAVVLWAESIQGGLPKLLRAEVKRARSRRGRDG
jgi:hypothetical protein